METTRRSCDYEGCNRDHYALGYCKTHYKRDREDRPLPVGIVRVSPGIYNRLFAIHEKTGLTTNQALDALLTTDK